ncbi:MAG: hypothetical protein WBR18_10825 [Anaerolineales bacterium]
MSTEPIYPILMSPQWEPRPDSFSKRLEVPSDDPSVPWITLGRVQSQDVHLLNGDLAGNAEASGDDLLVAAIGNLSDRDASWHRVDSANGSSSQSEMLACVDDLLAPEHILDSNFVAKAQHKLNTEILAVGIPRRGLIVAMDGRQPETSLMGFGALNLAEYHSGDSEPITPLTFLMADGKFSGLMQFGTG